MKGERIVVQGKRINRHNSFYNIYAKKEKIMLISLMLC